MNESPRMLLTMLRYMKHRNDEATRAQRDAKNKRGLRG